MTDNDQGQQQEPQPTQTQAPRPAEADPNEEISHADQVAANGPHAPGQCVICDTAAKAQS